MELLPGLARPCRPALERFGMTPDEAHVLLAAAFRSHQGMQCMSLTRDDYAELRHAHDAWLSGLLFDRAWATIATFDDVVVTVARGGLGRADRLSRIGIDVGTCAGRQAAVPAVWDGADLFGQPAQDVVSVLPGPTARSTHRVGGVLFRHARVYGGRKRPYGDLLLKQGQQPPAGALPAG
ncbi:hypothetical protein ACFYOV_29595 [Streptomyces sp. NPDC005931]|uniref:hypothetical protein n=1 Tax=Streptomyces sp. NPDC005931 TaxID=3364737 RepID=UPI0036BB2569